MPDLVSFGYFVPRMYLNGTHKQFRKAKTEKEIAKLNHLFPSWVMVLYNATHSLVVFSFVFSVVWLVMGWFPYPLLGWLVHILVDIPTHRKAFFPTKIFYPFSDWCVDGIYWGRAWFMILNYGLIIVGLVWRLFF